MAAKMLESSALSAYCESIALMLAAGIQTEEAVHLLGDNMQEPFYKETCDQVYRNLISGAPLSVSMEQTGRFPRHAIDMVAAGEKAGRLEEVLSGLSRYYDEEDRLFEKIKSAIGYPAALLGMMTVILLFTVVIILPVFISVYQGLSGDLTTGSFSFVNVSVGIGWVALAVTLLCAIFIFIGVSMIRTQRGRIKVVSFLERMPYTRRSLRQLALSRFTSALATFIASGINTDESMDAAVKMVEHNKLRAQLRIAQSEMMDIEQAKSLAQAMYDNDVFEPIYARMLVIGTRTGSLEVVLQRLADTSFEDSLTQIDKFIDSVEPALAAFLTLSVGATLIAVMLPLIGIMGSIG